MKTDEFKRIFGELAKKNGFQVAFAGWSKIAPDNILVLELQKSSYSSLYYLNIKLFIQGVFRNTYILDKKLVKPTAANIFTRQPNAYSHAFDLENDLSHESRTEELEKLFREYLVPFSEKAQTRTGIRTLAEENKIDAFPAVKGELVRLGYFG